MPSPRRVLVTTRLFDKAAADHLTAEGFEVVFSGLPPDALDTDIPDDRLDALLDGVEGWIVGMRPVTRAVLERHPQLKVIARRGVGYDAVDAEAARELGRVVAIAAGANAPSVADHTLALMLALAKRLKESQAHLAADDWRVVSGTDLYGKTVGLIGFGTIARMVARRLVGFETRTLVYTRRPDPAYGIGCKAAQGPGHDIRYVDFGTLLAQSDFVSLHVPLRSNTRHLIDAAALARMKPSAVLVNTSRGGLIDEAALLAALEAGRLAGAGLDVFDAENDPALKPLAARLVARPDVVCTPHAAGSSREALSRGNMISAQNVIAVLTGREPPAECIVADGR